MRTVLRSRLSRADLAVLQRLADGELLVVAEVTGWRTLERRLLLRVDFGRADSPDHDNLCCFITDRGREALAHRRANR